MIITETPTEHLTNVERSQIERLDWAIEAWGRGEIETASIFIETILAERMTPRVAVRTLVSQAAFRAEAGDYLGSFESLEKAATFLDAADLKTQGAFYNQRARLHNRRGNFDAALLDYAGALVCFQSIGNRSCEGAALLNTAELYFQKNDLRQAREGIDRAMRAMLECRSEYLPQCYDTLAKIDLAEGKLESATNAIKQAVALVGDNGIWQQTLLETKEKIDKKVQELSALLHSVNVAMVHRALIKTGGSLTQAGKLTGLTHKGVSYIVDRHPELESFRVKRRTRTKLKSIIK